MNNSGSAVADYRPEDLIVVHDDLDLDAGTVRVKVGGGAGGHNGLRSIIQNIGQRLRPGPYRHRTPPGRRHRHGLRALAHGLGREGGHSPGRRRGRVRGRERPRGGDEPLQRAFLKELGRDTAVVHRGYRGAYALVPKIKISDLPKCLYSVYSSDAGPSRNFVEGIIYELRV